MLSWLYQKVTVLGSRSRAKVEELSKEFHELLKEKLREGSLKPRAIKRMSVLIKLTMTLIRRNSVNMVKTLGHSHGVRIGDEFKFRAKLCLIGLHLQFTQGIDFLKEQNGDLGITFCLHIDPVTIIIQEGATNTKLKSQTRS